MVFRHIIIQKLIEDVIKHVNCSCYGYNRISLYIAVWKFASSLCGQKTTNIYYLTVPLDLLFELSFVDACIGSLIFQSSCHLWSHLKAQVGKGFLFFFLFNSVVWLLIGSKLSDQKSIVWWLVCRRFSHFRWQKFSSLTFASWENFLFPCLMVLTNSMAVIV